MKLPLKIYKSGTWTYLEVKMEGWGEADVEGEIIPVRTQLEESWSLNEECKEINQRGWKIWGDPRTGVDISDEALETLERLFFEVVHRRHRSYDSSLLVEFLLLKMDPAIARVLLEALLNKRPELRTSGLPSLTIKSEKMERNFEFREMLDSIGEHLTEVTYSQGDLSDVGNELGIAVGRALEGMTQDEIEDFISGLRHGISLTNGTH